MIPNELQQNPFPSLGKWWFTDENNDTHGPFADQHAALKALLQYIDHRAFWSWWDTLWDKMKAFWHDTRGAR